MQISTPIDLMDNGDWPVGQVPQSNAADAAAQQHSKATKAHSVLVCGLNGGADEDNDDELIGADYPASYYSSSDASSVGEPPKQLFCETVVRCKVQQPWCVPQHAFAAHMHGMHGMAHACSCACMQEQALVLPASCITRHP